MELSFWNMVQEFSLSLLLHSSIFIAMNEGGIWVARVVFWAMHTSLSSSKTLLSK